MMHKLRKELSASLLYTVKAATAEGFKKQDTWIQPRPNVPMKKKLKTTNCPQASKPLDCNLHIKGQAHIKIISLSSSFLG